MLSYLIIIMVVVVVVVVENVLTQWANERLEGLFQLVFVARLLAGSWQTSVERPSVFVGSPDQRLVEGRSFTVSLSTPPPEAPLQMAIPPADSIGASVSARPDLLATWSVERASRRSLGSS